MTDLDPISVLVDGKTHQTWQRYRIDSNLLTPADDWSMTVATEANIPTPDNLFEGAEARIMLGDDLILTGLIDDLDEPVDKRGGSIELSGRDRASILLDCSAPLMSLQQATLEQIIKKAVEPLGIKEVIYQAKASAPRKKVHIEPGQSTWEWLQAACEVNNVWPWFSPDGKLIIGAPDYKAAPIAHLVMRFNGDGNNMLSLARNRSMKDSFSEITVLGQSAGDGDGGSNDIRASAKDETMPVYRPKVVVDGNCDTAELAQRRANKLIADSKMARERLTVRVQGHRIVTSEGTGKPWTPGVRVHVYSEPHGIDETYYLIGRTFTLSRTEGRLTELHLIPDGVWLLNLAFIKAKRRSDSRKRKGHYSGGN